MQEKLVENAIPLSQEVGFSVVAGYASGLALRFAGKCVDSPCTMHEHVNL